jgi:hypothetical protein
MPQIAKPPDATEALGGADDRTFWTPCISQKLTTGGADSTNLVSKVRNSEELHSGAHLTSHESDNKCLFREDVSGYSLNSVPPCHRCFRGW